MMIKEEDADKIQNNARKNAILIAENPSGLRFRPIIGDITHGVEPVKSEYYVRKTKPKDDEQI